MTRYLYRFGAGEADGHGEQTALLGGKGANLAEMTHLGVPIPPGFTLTTEVCTYFHDHEQRFPDDLIDDVSAGLDHLGELTESRFADGESPLVLAVRAGAAEALPGLLRPILNLGLNDETVLGLAARSGDLRFAYDCYRRFVANYGEVVMGVRAQSEYDDSPFVRILQDLKVERGA
ncbi:MAG: PEP/pyruvate-binding domain-containing protein, partial [Myxococcota bacterium]